MGKLYQKLDTYGKSDYYPYHMPGHKRRGLGDMPEEIMGLDITEIDGFDNLHQAEGILQELQDKASELYGAGETFYLVNGSTCGILAAISAAVPGGGHILMARNCHKSAYHGAYLRNLTISYLYPTRNTEYDILEVITPTQVEAALNQEPDIAAVLIVSPTYEGRIADIGAIAEIVHQRNIPLIVDEAHGAHLGLAEGFAPGSCTQGADLVIHSVHKTLPSLTQTALLHVNGNLVDSRKIRKFLHIYQSSSPSYLLMASIDNALQVVAEQGKTLFAEFRRNFSGLLEDLTACRNLQFVPLQENKQDIGKLVISSKKTGLSGQQIYDILLREYHLQLEMAAGSFCLAMFTLTDTVEAYDRMKQALLTIDEAIEKGTYGLFPYEKCRNAENKRAGSIAVGCKHESTYDSSGQKANSMQKQKAIPLSQAWDMDWEELPLGDAVGRYVGEFINLYPPGTPLLVPGEVLQKEQYELLLEYFKQGLNVQGVEATPPHLVRVLKQDKM